MKATFSEVRLALRKGEMAIEILEKLGYTYTAQPNSQPKWLEPLNTTTDSELVKKIRQLLNPCEEANLSNPAYEFTIDTRKLARAHFSSLSTIRWLMVLGGRHREVTGIGSGLYQARRVTFRYHFPGDSESTLLWVPREAVIWQEAKPNDSVRH